MWKQLNQLRCGVILSYINMLLGMIIPFFYTPIVLRMLGKNEYGLFALSHSVVSYLTLLSFGFGTTIVRYLSKYRAEKNSEAVSQIYGFFLAVYGALAVIVIACGFGISQNVDFIFKKGLTDTETAKMMRLVLIMGLTSALSFPASVFTSIIIAYERFVFRNIINILSTVLLPLGNLIALYSGYGSIGMAVASLVLQTLFVPWHISFVTFKLGIRPVFKLPSRQLLGEILLISFYNFLGAIVDMLFWATDKVILGMLANTGAVAVYSIGATFNHMIIALSTSISSVLSPKITGMIVNKSTSEQLSEIFIRVGRLQFVIIGLVISGFIVFGNAFLQKWVGLEYQDAYYIALLTMIPLCVPLIQNTGLLILVAQNKQKFRSLVYLIIAILNVISTYIVVPYMQAMGAAVCSCVTYTIGFGIIMNWYYAKCTGLQIGKFWLTIAKMAICPVGLLLVSKYILHIYSRWITNWPIFFACCFLYLLFYVLLMYCFVLNNYEKNLFHLPQTIAS